MNDLGQFFMNDSVLYELAMYKNKKNNKNFPRKAAHFFSFFS